MKKLFIIIQLLFVLPSFGQEFKKVGSSGFVFLEIPVTARVAALGEACVALADLNSDGVFLNPAALGLVSKEHSVSFSYAPWFAEMKHYATSYAYNSSVGVVGVSAVVFDFGTMPRTQRSLGQRVYEVIGEFKANALSLGLTYSRKLTEQFSFGVTLKYVRESIDIYNASNILFDGGVLYYTGVGSWRIAASLQHFGTETAYKGDQFKMPSILRLGTAAEIIGDYQSDVRVTASVEATHPTDAVERINVGLEVGWQNLLMVRGGYKFFYDEETYSLGVGLNPQASVPVGVDFAFSDYGRLGKIVRFTVHMELE